MGLSFDWALVKGIFAHFFWQNIPIRIRFALWGNSKILEICAPAISMRIWVLAYTAMRFTLNYRLSEMVTYGLVDAFGADK